MKHAIFEARGREGVFGKSKIEKVLKTLTKGSLVTL